MDKKLLVLVGALSCLLAPSTSSAQGQVLLRWDECGDQGVLTKHFACDSNTPVYTMVSSFTLAAPVPHFVGATTELVIALDASDMPAWWRLETGGCRAGAVSSEDLNAFAFTGCANPFQGVQTLGLSHIETPYLGNPHRARVIVDLARADNGVSLAAGTHYQANAIQIRSSRTVGSGACAGCGQAVCIAVIRLFAADLDDDFTVMFDGGLAQPNEGRVAWQDSEEGVCFGTIPARRASWGGVKSLYR